MHFVVVVLISIQLLPRNQAPVQMYVEEFTGEFVFRISTVTHRQLFTVELISKGRFLSNNQRYLLSAGLLLCQTCHNRASLYRRTGGNWQIFCTGFGRYRSMGGRVAPEVEGSFIFEESDRQKFFWVGEALKPLDRNKALHFLHHRTHCGGDIKIIAL